MSVISSKNKLRAIDLQSTKNTQNTIKLKSFNFNTIQSNNQISFVEQTIVENYLLSEDNDFVCRNKLDFIDISEKIIPCVKFIPMLSTTEGFNIDTDRINFSYDWHLKTGDNDAYYVMYGMYAKQAEDGGGFAPFVPIYFTLKMVVIPYYNISSTEGKI